MARFCKLRPNQSNRRVGVWSLGNWYVLRSLLTSLCCTPLLTHTTQNPRLTTTSSTAPPPQSTTSTTSQRTIPVSIQGCVTEFTSANATPAMNEGRSEYSEYFEVSLEFMNLPNVHAVRRAMRRMQDAILGSHHGNNHHPSNGSILSLTNNNANHASANDTANAEWLAQLHASKWLALCSSMIAASNQVVLGVLARKSVLVHCADGW
jgi:hypothetical protein